MADIQQYRSADYCDCEHPTEDDGIHVAGDPVEIICLASPIVAESSSSEGDR